MIKFNKNYKHLNVGLIKKYEIKVEKHFHSNNIIASYVLRKKK